MVGVTPALVAIAQDAGNADAESSDVAVIDSDVAVIDSGELILSPPQAQSYPPAFAVDGVRLHAVHLRVDGNLAGRVSAMASSGALMPARATMSFGQNGQMINSSRSDERGNFQVVGIQPGVYSVIATGPDGFSAFSVQILPFDETAPMNMLLLDITLSPLEFMDWLRPVEPAAILRPVTPYSTVGGGGGGGGAGLGAALGLAGLAGLGAATGGGGGQSVASPAVP